MSFLRGRSRKKISTLALWFVSYVVSLLPSPAAALRPRTSKWWSGAGGRWHLKLSSGRGQSVNGEVSCGDKAATHRGYSWSPASLSLSLPTLQDSLCPAPSRCSIDICWMSSVNDQLVALIYSRNHMTSRERRYLMSQIHLVGESVFMIPGLKAKCDPYTILLWVTDQRISHTTLPMNNLESLPPIRCQPVYITPSLRNRLPSHPNSMLYLHKSQVAKEGTHLAVPTLPTHSGQVQPCFHCIQSQGLECLLRNEWGFYSRLSLFQTSLLSSPQLRELGQVPPPLWGCVYVVVKRW